MIIKRMICFLLSILLLSGCSSREEINSLNDLPNNEEFTKLSEEQRAEICKYIYAQDNDTISEYIKDAYKKQIEETEGIELKSIEIYEDTLMVADGKRPLNNLQAEISVILDIDNDISEDDKYMSVEEWHNKVIEKVRIANMVALLKVKTTITTFIDKDTGKSYDKKASVSMGGDMYGIVAQQPKGEKVAMEAVNKVIQKDGEEFTKLNPTETYTRTRLDKFGIVEAEVYVEATILVPRDDDEAVLKKLAEDIAQVIKDSKEYVESNNIQSIKIMFHSSLYGDLEYVFEV